MNSVSFTGVKVYPDKMIAINDNNSNAYFYAKSDSEKPMGMVMLDQFASRKVADTFEGKADGQAETSVFDGARFAADKVLNAAIESRNTAVSQLAKHLLGNILEKGASVRFNATDDKFVVKPNEGKTVQNTFQQGKYNINMATVPPGFRIGEDH